MKAVLVLSCVCFLHLAKAQQDLRYPLSDLIHQKAIVKAAKVRTATFYTDSVFQCPMYCLMFDHEGRLVGRTNHWAGNGTPLDLCTYGYDSLDRLVGETYFWARPLLEYSPYEDPQPPFTDTLKTFREIKYNMTGEVIYEHIRQGKEVELWIQKKPDAKNKTWQQASLSPGRGLITYYRTDSVKGYSRRVVMDADKKITQTRIREYNPDGNLWLECHYDHTRPKLRDSLLVGFTRYIFRNIEGKTLVEKMVYDWPQKKRKPANIILHQRKVYDSNADEVIYTDLLSTDSYNHTLFYSYIYSDQKLLQKVIMSDGYTGKSETLYYVQYTFWE